MGYKMHRSCFVKKTISNIHQFDKPLKLGQAQRRFQRKALIQTFKRCFCCNIIKFKEMDLQAQRKSGRKSTPKEPLLQDSYESEFCPQIYKLQTKKMKSGKKVQRKKYCIFNNSTWTLQENILYKEFMINHKHWFGLGKEQRRAIKINVLMSKFVKTRTSEQCRSHHQKMILHHGDLDSIVAYIQGLEQKKDDGKEVELKQSEGQKETNSLNLEMKEIEQVKVVTPSLWECVVHDVWDSTD